MSPTSPPLSASGGTFGGASEGSPVVPVDPPPFVARAVGWIVLALFVTAAIVVLVVEVPEVVELPFVLVDGSPPRAKLTVAEREIGRIRRGTRVRLQFDAFPPERDGTLEATVDTDPAAGVGTAGFFVTAKLELVPAASAGARIVPVAGLHGRARIEVARRSLAARWFGWGD